MAEYDFGLRATGVEELRAQLRALRSDGTQAFGDLEAAGSRGLQRLDAAQRDHGAVVERSAASYSVLAERVRSLDSASGRSLPALTDTGRAFGEIEVSAGRGGAALSAYATTVGALDHTMSTFAVSVEKTIGHVAGVAQTAVDGVVSLGQTAMAAIGGVIGVLEIGSIIDNLSRLRAVTMGETDALEAMGDSADEAGVSLTGLAAHWVAYRAAAAGAEAVGLPYLGTMVALLGRANVYIGTAVALAGGLTAAARATDALTEAQAGLDKELERTHYRSGQTTQRIMELARAEEDRTGRSQQQIAAAAQALLAYDGVSGRVFDRAVRASADLAQKYGVDLTKAAAELGQALQDPARGLDGLTERGVAFSFATREAIKAATDLGDTMRASGLVLDTVEQQAGGAAAGIDEAARASARLDAEIRRFLEVVGPYAVKLREIKDAVVKLFTEPSTWLENKAADVVGWINRQVDPGPLSERITEVAVKLAELKRIDAEATQRGGLTDRVWSQQRKKEIEDYQARYNALLDQARQLEIADQKAAEGLAAGERERRSRGMKDVGAAIAQGLGALPQGIEGRVKAINTEMDGLIDKLEALRAPDGSNGAEIDKEIARVEMLRESKLQQAKASEASKAAGSEETDEREAAVEAIDNIIDRLVRERDAINLSERAKYVNNAALEAERAARDRLNEGELAEYIRQVQYEAGVTYDAVAAKKAKVKADEDQARAAEQAARDLARVSETVSKDVSTMVWDGITGKAKSEDAFKYIMNWVKRLGVELLSQNIILPITMQVVGAVPQLFGIQGGSSVAAQIGSGGGMLGGYGQYLSAGQNAYQAFQGGGGMVGTAGNWFVTSSAGQSLGLSTAYQLPAAGSVPVFTPGMIGSSAEGVGLASGSSVISGNTVVAPTASGASFSSGLSAIGSAAPYGFLGGMGGAYIGNATGSKALGGLSGAALGVGSMAAGTAAMGAMGMGAAASAAGLSGMAGATAALSAIPVYGWIAAAALAAITAIAGTQKPTVGPTASADITVNAGGKSASAGNFLTDNGGDIKDAEGIGQAFSTIFSAAAAGGGTLSKNFGIGRTAAKGLYVAGSEPYTEFGTGDDALGNLLRFTLLERGGLTGAGPNVTRAIQNTRATTYEDAAKDIALGASLDAGTTALAALDKSLSSFTKSAKDATADAMKPMLEEFKRAEDLGLGVEYVGLATAQLKAYLDQVKTPVDYTQREQEMAALTGQFQAIRNAVVQVTPEMAAYADQIEAETRARIKAGAENDANRALNDSIGRGYVNSINDLIQARDINARNLAAVGVDTARATEIFDASLRGVLEGLVSSDLDVVATLFTGSIHDLAVGMRDAAAATEEAAKAAELAAYTTDLNSRMQSALGNDRGAALIALDLQQAQQQAAAKAAGRDTAALSQIQLGERQRQAFYLAKADLLAGYDQQIGKLQDMAAALQNGAVATDQVVKQFRDAYDRLALSDASPLAPVARLSEITRQWDEAYATAKSATASKEEREAAAQKLLSLGDSYVAADRSVNATASTAAWDKVRGVYAEFGDVRAEAKDTASKQLDAINEEIAELQRQRADANRMGEKQYGALSGLKSVADQSYAIWQAALAPLQRLTGTAPTAARYSAPAAVQSAWNGLSAEQQHGIARAMGWGGELDEAFNLWLANSTQRAATFGDDVTTIAGGARYGAPDDVGRAWEALTQAQRLTAVRGAGYDGGLDAGLNAWVRLGHQSEFEASVLAAAKGAGVPGYVGGGVVTTGTWNLDSFLTLLAGGEHVTRAPAVNGETLPVLDWINRTGRVPADLGGRSPGRDEAAGEVRSLHRTVDGLARTVDRMAGAIVALAEEQLSELTGIRSATERKGFSV